MYSDWIKNGIHKPGKSAVGLAQAITKALKMKRPMHRISVHKMINGNRRVRSEELLPIATYIEEPIPNMPVATESVHIDIKSEVCAGTWTESCPVVPSIGTIVAQRDHEFPNSDLMAYAFKGDSMITVGILDGDVIICIPAEDDKLEDGRQVVVERTRAGLVELSARVVKTYPDRIEYVAASQSERYKPCVVHKKKRSNSSSENEAVKVVAIIRRVTRNIP